MQHTADTLRTLTAATGQAAGGGDSRPDRDRQECARAGAGGAVRRARSSTAIRRRSTAGFDIGTDKVPVPERRGHPAPSDRRGRADRGLHGGALRGGCDARDPGHPGSPPSAAGGGRDRPLLPRADARAVPGARRGSRASGAARSASRSAAASAFSTAWCSASIRRPAARILPRDRKRLVRALEVYFLTGRAADGALRRDGLADRLLRGGADRAAHPGGADVGARDRRGCDAQFARGLMDEVRGLLARGVPETRTTVRRAGVPAGDRVAARRARRARPRVRSSCRRTAGTRAGS